MDAYFIGGSWDLTKRYIPSNRKLQRDMLVIVAPAMPVMAPDYRSANVAEAVHTTRETYRLVRHEFEHDLAIYRFDPQAIG